MTKKIDKIYIRNRSQAIELIIREYFKNYKPKEVIILLGRSKVDKKRILDILSWLRNIGIDTIIIAAGQNNKTIFDILGNNYLNLKIFYVKEKKLLGTAGAIKAAFSYITSTFLVIAGDTSFNFDINQMIDFHRSKNSIATMGITAVELSKSTDNIDIDGDKIVSFNYNDKTRSYFTNAGIYIFEPIILNYLPAKGSLEKDVFPKLAKEGKLYGYIFSRGWEHAI